MMPPWDVVVKMEALASDRLLCNKKPNLCRWPINVAFSPSLRTRSKAGMEALAPFRWFLHPLVP